MILAIISASGSSYAGGETGKPSDDAVVNAVKHNEPYFFFGVKPWATSWDVPLVDTRIIVANPVGPTVAAQQYSLKVESGVSVVPLTILGVRYGDYTISASISPETDYSTNGQSVGKVSRDEADINLGYAFTPNILGSVVYKTAKINDVFSKNSSLLTGLTGGYSVKGLLIGLSASAPLQDKLSLYGNFAVGLAREKAGFTDANGKSSYRGTYKIGEVGLSRRLLEGGADSMLKSLTMQIGYRFQNVSMSDLGFGTYDVGTGAVLGYDKRDVSSTTQGMVLGLIGSF